MIRKSLYLETKTLQNEMNNLFDFESNHTKDKDLVLNKTSYITRHNQYINSNNNLNSNSNNIEILFKVNHKNNEFIIESPIQNNILPTEKNINDLNNKIWYVAKRELNQNIQNIDNNNADINLHQDDIIKLGRTKYLITEINVSRKVNNKDLQLKEEGMNEYGIDNINNEPVFDRYPLVKDASEFNYPQNEEALCKVCYSGNYDRENDPLINMCNCKGGIKFCHFLCIKNWLKTKLIVRENLKKTVKNYFVNNFNCELCKVPYFYKFKIKGLDKTFELIDIEKPKEEKDYIILESLNHVKNNCNNKSIHVAELTGDDLILGRNLESDIICYDISISRNHALLKYNSNNGNITLRDYNSKFGTLVLVKSPLLIKEGKIHLQIGRSYFSVYTINTNTFYKNLFKVEYIEKEEINEIDNNNNKKKDKMVIEEIDNIQN